MGKSRPGVAEKIKRGGKRMKGREEVFFMELGC